MPEAFQKTDLALTLSAIGDQKVTVDTGDISSVVKAVMETLTGDVTIADFQLYHELESLADYIRAAKREIADLRPHDIRERHIPMATDELDAVVQATAEATGVILDSAESIEKIADTMQGAAAEELRQIVTRIYEASNFQDITGQRITKVVRTLKYIEEKIDALLAAFGESAGAPKQQEEDELPPGDERRLLHGPQLGPDANGQDDIDAIFANLK